MTCCSIQDGENGQRDGLKTAETVGFRGLFCRTQTKFNMLEPQLNLPKLVLCQNITQRHQIIHSWSVLSHFFFEMNKIR